MNEKAKKGTKIFKDGRLVSKTLIAPEQPGVFVEEESNHWFHPSNIHPVINGDFSSIPVVDWEPDDEG
jgi:hypothetical protein